MDVTPEFVAQVARLARLRLTAEEIATLAPQLARILETVEAIGAAAPSDGDVAPSPAVSASALRPDEPAPCLDRRAVLRGAPQHDGVFFVVPRVLGSD